MGAPSQAEALIKCCSEIVGELAKAHETSQTVNLNQLRHSVSKRHKLHGNPRLVDIIAAVPEGLRAALLPKLKAKPIRTASGVNWSFWLRLLRWLTPLADCCGSRHEQAAPVSPHRCYRKCLRVGTISSVYQITKFLKPSKQLLPRWPG